MIVIKATCFTSKDGSTRVIRRIPMSRLPGELTYDELCIMLQRVFKKELVNPDKMVLRYADEDSDLVHLESDIDISHALSINNTLKVFIFDSTVSTIPSNLSQCSPSNASTHVQGIFVNTNLRSQVKLCLKDIRDRVNQLLDSLEDTTDSGTAGIVKAVENAIAPGKALKKSDLAEFLPDSSKTKLEAASASAPPLTPSMTVPPGISNTTVTAYTPQQGQIQNVAPPHPSQYPPQQQIPTSMGYTYQAPVPQQQMQQPGQGPPNYSNQQPNAPYVLPRPANYPPSSVPQTGYASYPTHPPPPPAQYR